MRRWLTLLLPKCSARDDLTFVASELAANAVVHTASGRPGGRFLVEVIWSPSIARVAVADSGAPSAPHVISDPAGERGRGLLVVTGLAARIGVWGDQRGRLVWADVPWEDDHAPTAEPSADQWTWFGGIFSQQSGLGSMPLTGPLLGGPVANGLGSAGPSWQPGVGSPGGPRAAAQIAVTGSTLAGGAS
ncbi:MAG: ATP-binding protein [Streptosporangiaceae bacterium]